MDAGDKVFVFIHLLSVSYIIIPPPNGEPNVFKTRASYSWCEAVIRRMYRSREEKGTLT